MGLGFSLMACLIVAYLVIAGVFVYEGKFVYATYWAAASVLTACVLAMGQR